MSFRQPSIFLYHEVTKDKKMNSLIDKFNITHSVKQFKKHVNLISKNFNLISFSDLENGKRHHEDMSDCALITFDDGYYDSCVEASSILAHYGQKGLWFLNNDFIDGKEVFWLSLLIENFKRERNKTCEFLRHFIRNVDFSTMNISQFNYEMKKQYSFKLHAALNDTWITVKKNFEKTFLNSSDISELVKKDICDFGNHTSSHPNMMNLTRRQNEDQILYNKKQLENFGIDDKGCFAIPFGIKGEHWNEITIETILDCGYDFIFSVFKENKFYNSQHENIYYRHQVPTNLNNEKDILNYINNIKNII